VRSLAEIVLRPRSVATVIPERTAGVTFTLALLERCRARGLGVFLIGSPKASSIDHTATHLEGLFPGLRVVGTAPGRIDPRTEARTVEALRRATPDIVLVGLGFPLQERLMARLAGRLEHGVLIGEGGSFDFRELGGRIRRAPPLLRGLGLEWFWRLGREPTRLRRQLAIPRFVAAVQRQTER
jgi:N-acetylglucosaminyldiphosphoundecaprenol N-acetyl-beta-D-mannosaminyltransferase